MSDTALPTECDQQHFFVAKSVRSWPMIWCRVRALGGGGEQDGWARGALPVADAGHGQRRPAVPTAAARTVVADRLVQYRES